MDDSERELDTNEVEPGPKGKTPPSWAMAPLNGFRYYVEQEQNLVLLSRRGIQQIIRGVPLAKALADYDKVRLEIPLPGESQDEGRVPEDSAAGVQEAVELARLAEIEEQSDFRLLHGHSLVGVWGALETMVADLVAAWLLHVPAARQMPQVAGVKIPVAEFDSLSSEERMDAIVRELDRQVGRRQGIDRFEGLLDAIMLSGSYNGTLGDNLYEMQHVRNVFAHRRGLADRRFVRACPHLGVQVGQLVPFGEDPWVDCLVSSITYAMTVVSRVREHFGVPKSMPPVEVVPIRFAGRT